MNLIGTLARLNFGKIWELLGLSLGHITFLWPTYRATRACMSISTKHFGRKHYQNGQANAFRHALWNVLIAKACFKGPKNLQKSISWTKRITDWHETAFFSKTLPMKMDYHNNAIGRWLFSEHWKWTEEQFIEQLLKLTHHALMLNEHTDLSTIKNQLVYITNDH